MSREILEAACRGAEDRAAWPWGETSAEGQLGASARAAGGWGEWAGVGLGLGPEERGGGGVQSQGHGGHALLLVAD